MTNADYITINENGVFVGGKLATTYRSVNIYNIPNAVKYFQESKQKIKDERGLDLLELHALASSTPGNYAEPGNPSPKRGRYAWCRAKLTDGTELDWVFLSDYSSASNCASYCAINCGRYVLYHAVVRGAVFSAGGNGNTQPAKSPVQQAVNTSAPKPGDIIEQSFGNQIMKLKVIEITQKQRQ